MPPCAMQRRPDGTVAEFDFFPPPFLLSRRASERRCGATRVREMRDGVRLSHGLTNH